MIIKKYKKVIILCRGNSVTGGSELIHQLCHEINCLNKQAFVCYYPFNNTYEIPKEYEIYDVDQHKLTDQEDVLIILPEVATKFAWSIKRATVSIWWLSIDNYFRKKGDNALRDSIKYYKDLIRMRLMPLFLMRKFMHFVQSKYAYDYLESKSIKSSYLSDYLNPVHFDNQISNKENIILYNPVKGTKLTQELISRNQAFKFIPLENLSNSEVRELFQRAKIYIDFGNHPGKDRMPREAAMANCCIITGRKGSAFNDVDIPIPQIYKYEDNEVLNGDKFHELISNIFNDFEKNISNFVPYKNKIRLEREVFKQQVTDLFSDLLYEK